MSQIILIIVLVLALAFLAAAGVFNVRTASNITDIPEWDAETDELVLSAHKTASWASVVCWVGIFLVFVAIGVFLYFSYASPARAALVAKEAAAAATGAAPSSGAKIFLYVILIFCILLLVAAYALEIQTFISLTNSTTTGGLEARRLALQANYIASSVTLFSIAFIGMFFVGILVC